MHSDGWRLFPRLTKAILRRQVVRFVELLIYGAILSVGCVAAALFVGWALQLLGVSYG